MSNETKHTPGPWGYIRLEPKKDGFEIITTINGNRIGINVGYGGGPPDAIALDVANLNLICTAPDMLAALRAFEKGFADGSIKFTRRRVSDSDPYHEANTLMCAAIAKAEGRDPAPPVELDTMNFTGSRD